MRLAWIGMVVAACGNQPDVRPDVRLPDAPQVHTTFVVDRVLVPEKTADASTYTTDLDGDGLRDNALGLSIGVVASAGSIPQQQLEDDAVAQGQVLELVRLDAGALATYQGLHPMPQPCVDPQQPTPQTCARHLQGTGTFDVRTDLPAVSIAGATTAGRFTGGPGTAVIVLSLFDSAPIPIQLAGARVSIDVAGDRLGPGVLAGGVPQTEMHDVVLPAIAAGMSARMASECGGACACPGGSRGAAYRSMFDKAPADCAISADELAQSDLLKTLLAPDVVIDGVPCLSLGVGFTAVPGSF